MRLKMYQADAFADKVFSSTSPCRLTSLWAARPNKEKLAARQISARGITIHCLLKDGRIGLEGRAALMGKADKSYEL